jgi:hypothetical protein
MIGLALQNGLVKIPGFKQLAGFVQHPGLLQQLRYRVRHRRFLAGKSGMGRITYANGSLALCRLLRLPG